MSSDSDVYYYANAIGDSFMNKCFTGSKFLNVLKTAYTPFFGWSEPYPLLLLILLLLIILPSIFKYGSKSSFLKISRLYTVTRLGLLSLIHQVDYSYTVVTPLSMIIRQPRPCALDNLAVSIGDYSFPTSVLSSAELFTFAVLRFLDQGSISGIVICAVFITLMTIFSIAAQFCSVFQAISTILISYILHYIHIYIPFRYIFVEDAILFALNLGVSIVYLCNGTSFRSLFFNIWFSFVVIIIDLLLILRHQISRGGFPTVERPADLQWSTDIQHGETIRLLNSEEEENFYVHVENDVVTSFIAFCIFFLSVLLRRIVAPNTFFRE